MSGQRIKQYEILEPLGSGAFGTVYLARDTVLGRRVVIKLLRPSGSPEALRDRTLEEARLASAIEHPNVCPIYEVDEHEGQTFIVMQHVPGRTLRHHLDDGPLAVRFALSVGIQVAEGLSAAHDLGILHRDLKPENVMIAGDGVAKVLDFGLARRSARSRSGPDATPAAPVSQVPPSSDRFGTAAYMAPEQLTLRRSSEQTDLFALGVILFEMLTGQHPFLLPGMEPLRLAAAIRTDSPGVPSRIRAGLPESVDQVVLRALAKQPSNRFRYARDLSEALKGLMRSLELETGVVAGELSAPLPAPAVPRERRGGLAALVDRLLPGRGPAPLEEAVAVLPFRSLDPEADASADARLYGYAVSNAVSARLARVPDVSVRPLSAFLSVADRPLDPVEAGRRLGADRVLLGTFGRSGAGLAVHWELLDVASGAVRDGGTIHVGSADLAAAQEQVGGGIVASLRASGSLPEATVPGGGTRLEELPDDAREELLIARALLAGFTLRAGARSDLERARAAFQRVVERAPEFAPGHAGLGTVYLRFARNGFGGVDELRRADHHLGRALELEPGLVEAKLYRASTKIWAGEKDGARLDLQDLLVREPPDADIYLAAAVVLQLDGLLDEALRLQGLALRVNPAVAPRVFYYRARIVLFQGRTELARQEVEKGLAVEPGHTLLRHVLGFIQLQEGDVDAATATLEGVLAAAPTLRIVLPTLAMCLVRAGRREDAAALITDELLDAAAADAETAYRVAMYHATLPAVPEALDWLRRAIYLGNENYPWFASNPAWSAVRDEPEYREILEGLERAHQVNRVRWEAALARLA